MTRQPQIQLHYKYPQYLATSDAVQDTLKYLRGQRQLLKDADPAAIASRAVGQPWLVGYRLCDHGHPQSP